VWRIASSPRITDTAHAIQTQWSLDDLVDAHKVLDMYDELDRKASASSPAGGGSP